MSPVTSAPRWTPPMPPVAKTRTPDRGGEGDRRAHRGRPERPSAGRRRRRDRARQPSLAGPEDALVLGGVEPDPGHTVEHGGDRRNRPGGPDRPRRSGPAPRRWPVTAGRGWRRSSTRGRRRRRRRRVRHAPRRRRPATASRGSSDPGEPRHDFDVRRLGERVDHFRALVDVPGPAEQLGVTAERARVAADEHEHGSAESDEGGTSPVPRGRCAPGRRSRPRRRDPPGRANRRPRRGRSRGDER